METHGEPRTNDDDKDAAKSASASSKGSGEVRQSNRGPKRFVWNQIDAIDEWQEANNFTRRP